jgi:GntR family transcriptional repressor for pyruvate dehydrogenase complex
MSSQTVPKPLRLPDESARLLLERIRDGTYPAGSRLPPEKELADSFGVSRPVLREALLLLRHDGVIDSRQGSGVFVSRIPGSKTLRLGDQHVPNREWLAHTYELRAYVEEAGAELAALRRTTDQLARLRRELDGMALATARREDAVAEDVRFHLLIAEASANPALLKFMEYIHGTMEPTVRVARGNSAMAPGLPEQAQAEHEAIYAGIAAGDSASSRRAARAHMENAACRLGLPPLGTAGSSRASA